MQDGSFSVFTLYISDHVLVSFATQSPSLLIKHLAARNPPPFCPVSRAEAGTEAATVRLNALVWLTTGCHCLTEINRERLKTSGYLLDSYARRCRFHFKILFPIWPLSRWSFKGYFGVGCFCFKWILEDAFIFNINTKGRGKNEQNKVTSEHLRHAVLLKFVNYIYLLA